MLWPCCFETRLSGRAPKEKAQPAGSEVKSAGGRGHPGINQLGKSWCPLQAKQDGELGVFFNLDLKNTPLMRISPEEGSSKVLMPCGGRWGCADRGQDKSLPQDTMACGTEPGLWVPDKRLPVARWCRAHFSLVISLAFHKLFLNFLAAWRGTGLSSSHRKNILFSWRREYIKSSRL